MKVTLLILCLLPGLVTPLCADVIFNNADTPQFSTVRDGQGIAAYLGIGPANVSIDQIAINVAPAASGELEFAIFSDVASPGNSAGSLLFSDSVTVGASSSLGYVVSDPIAFTLQAGQYYDIGAIFNGNATYGYDLIGDSMNGITSIARNQNIGSFGNPVLLGHALGDAQIELFSNSAAAPEPSPITLMGFALGLVVIAKARVCRTHRRTRANLRLREK